MKKFSSLALCTSSPGWYQDGVRSCNPVAGGQFNPPATGKEERNTRIKILLACLKDAFL